MWHKDMFHVVVLDSMKKTDKRTALKKDGMLHQSQLSLFAKIMLPAITNNFELLKLNTIEVYVSFLTRERSVPCSHSGIQASSTLGLIPLVRTQSHSQI